MVNDSPNYDIKPANILRILGSLVIATAILIQPVASLANDTFVRIGAGGITFIKSEDIRMLEEILQISQYRVRVKYRFLNESDKDIHATVAFPLPARKGKFDAEPHPSSERFHSSFTVLVNGSPVTTTADQADAVVWEQGFPAGKEIVVEHSYVPMPGVETEFVSSMADAGLGSRMLNRVFLYVFGVIPTRGTGSDACLDRSTRTAIENQVKALQADDRKVYVVTRDIEYILGTGRNWKGPIGKFILRIEKEAPEDFISLCFPGKPKKVSPTVCEFVQEGFVPPDNLVVYFYRVTVSP